MAAPWLLCSPTSFSMDCSLLRYGSTSPFSLPPRKKISGEIAALVAFSTEPCQQQSLKTTLSQKNSNGRTYPQHQKISSRLHPHFNYLQRRHCIWHFCR